MTTPAGPKAVTPGNGRLESLTGLRFFAATAVLFVHLAFLWRNSHVIGFMNGLSRQGAVGVSLFFILSGFVMAWSRRETDTATSFYRRRVARIVPAYWVALFLFIPVDAYCARLTGPSLGRGLFNLTLLQAWVPSASWFSGGNPVGWSLSTEAFFYALFPLFALRVSRLTTRSKLMGIAAMSVLAVAIPLLVSPPTHVTSAQVGWSYWFIYISPLTRALEFGIGVAVGALLRDGHRTGVPLWVAVTLAGVSFLAAGQVPAYASYVAVTLLPFTLLIAVAAEADLAGRRSFLRQRHIVRLGEWSFAFYLVHALLVRALGHFVETHTVGLAVRAALVVVVVVLAWAVAALLYTFVERPMERRLRGRSLRAAPGALAAAAPPEGVHV